MVQKLSVGYNNIYASQLKDDIANKRIHKACYHRLYSSGQRTTKYELTAEAGDDERDTIDDDIVGITDDVAIHNHGGTASEQLLSQPSSNIKVAKKSTIKRFLSHLPFTSANKQQNNVSQISTTDDNSTTSGSTTYITSASRRSLRKTLSNRSQLNDCDSGMASAVSLLESSSIVRTPHISTDAQPLCSTPMQYTRYSQSSNQSISPLQSIENNQNDTFISFTTSDERSTSLSQATSRSKSEDSAFKELREWLMNKLQTGEMIPMLMISEKYATLVEESQRNFPRMSSSRTDFLRRRLENHFESKLCFVKQSNMGGTYVALNDLQFYLNLTLSKSKDRCAPIQPFSSTLVNEENKNIETIFDAVKILRNQIHKGLELLKEFDSEKLATNALADY
ncbi:unnamed protein product, partial [Didymodactylos carnosus]